MLTLYFAPGANSMAAHIALHEAGTTFDARPLSFARRENRAPEYLALHPEGKVPTLLIDGRPLTEGEHRFCQTVEQGDALRLAQVETIRPLHQQPGLA